MDDLLISLDASHRRPVLELILSEFADWQIILLTHDRYWFQLAREQLPDDVWKTVEIYERFDGDGLLCPLVRPVVNDMADALLEQADEFVADNHPAAACNYARSACELFLQRFCVTNSVKFAYREDGAPKPSLQKMLDAAMNKVSQDPVKHWCPEGPEGSQTVRSQSPIPRSCDAYPVSGRKGRDQCRPRNSGCALTKAYPCLVS
jgi:hypothetical protein